ncbi:TonB-dependent receptor [Flavobacteriaceae bacterium F08102]|nr:TonB-dependent receptor [Flavobacteriaceae bacterium F08102]
MKLSLYTLLFCLLNIVQPVNASTVFDINTFSFQNSFRGKVINKDTKIALPMVKVTISELGLETYTDIEGNFVFDKIALDKLTLIVELEEYTTQVVNITSSDPPPTILLVKNSVELEEVLIIGKQERKDGTTSTKIERKALEHIQATSLQEVMQLVPGKVVGNPSFSNTNQASIRQYGTDNLGSLGTSIIVNGANLSNNANLQQTSTARSGSSAGFSSSSGGGIDLRGITADNIASVEILRGIPSVEYGDLNAGVMIVKTKASKEPLQLKSRFNPKMSQFWIGKGFELSGNKGTVFTDLDYTKSYDKETNKYQKYERITGTLQHTYISTTENKWELNSTLAMGLTKDTYDFDPDFVLDSLKNSSEEKYVRFVNNGTFRFNSLFSKTLRYTVSAEYKDQEGYQQRFYNADIIAESYATNNSTNEVSYLPSAYLSKMYVNGKPLTLNAKLSNQFYLSSANINHNILAGIEWKMDANYGDGKSFNRPPRNTSGAAYRERAYSSIPALQQTSLYIQDKISSFINNRKLNIVAGLRYDAVQPFENSFSLNSLSPRVNISYDLPFNLALRGGFGVTSKAPTLLYLYPENAYFDFYSLNHYASDPNERLAIITTRVYNTQNTKLQLSKTNKYELGLDWDIANSRKNRLSLTGYYEKTENGYSLSTTINSVKFSNYPVYSISSRPEGQQPILSNEVENKTRFVSYFAPSNNINRTNKGIEFDLNLREIEAINTSFNINGAYTYTRSINNEHYILQQNLADRETTRIGVFDRGMGTVDQRIVTTLRAIHHIPEVSFVLSLSAQTIWMDQNKYLGYNPIPAGYIPFNTTGADPEIIYFSNEERQAIDPISDADIYRNINDSYFIEEKWDPLWLFNIKLTKEFKGGVSFSFYANNFVNNRPLKTSTRYPNQYNKRNIPFFFGSEISIKL